MPYTFTKNVQWSYKFSKYQIKQTSFSSLAFLRVSDIVTGNIPEWISVCTVSPTKQFLQLTAGPIFYTEISSSHVLRSSFWLTLVQVRCYLPAPSSSGSCSSPLARGSWRVGLFSFYLFTYFFFLDTGGIYTCLLHGYIVYWWGLAFYCTRYPDSEHCTQKAIFQCFPHSFGVPSDTCLFSASDLICVLSPGCVKVLCSFIACLTFFHLQF